MELADESAIRAELDALSATFGKADMARRLLTYLVDCHLRGKVPKETDIALDVFGRDAGFDGAQDAVVRVAVRAVRQKLDDFYHHTGRGRPWRLELPRGGYRLAIVANGDVSPAAGDMSATLAPPSSNDAASPSVANHAPVRAAAAAPRWVLGALVAALLASLVVNVMAWREVSDVTPVSGSPPGAAASSPLWQPLLSSERPLTIVLGDLLLFPNPSPDEGRIQLIRDARINTAEQLRSFLAARGAAAPGEPGTQVATTLIPKSVAYGLVNILPVVLTGTRRVEVRILDELQLEDLQTHDVLYLGPLVRIGPLADVLFRGSRFTFNYDQEPRRLHDTDSGSVYAPSPGRRENANDYGLFASLRGASGNRVMVFASVGSELGILPLMRSVTSPSGLDELEAALTHDGTTTLPDQFEALIAVSGYYRTDLSAELITASPRPHVGNTGAKVPGR